MNGLPQLSPYVLRQVEWILASGLVLAGAWCLGRLRVRFRPGEPLVPVITERRFTEYLQDRGAERPVAATVYRYLQEIQAIAVPLLPGDHLVWDLGLDEASLEQTIGDLARRLDRQLPGGFAPKLPGTVGELVAMLQCLPTAAGQANRGTEKRANQAA